MNRRFILIAGCFALSLSVGTHAFSKAERAVQKSAETVAEDNKIIKSPNDHRYYRHVKLKNGVGILLISDPKTDKAAVAVDVNAGSFHEPASRPGLAHFLEHMLFLGNEKYPQVDGYFEFVRAHGGTANAYTSSVRTQYFFDINAGMLQPAMDQLAQFFVSPTLDRAYIDRERNAVDAEYKMHLKEDNWRQYFALSATVNPKHPRSRFTIGNLESLDNRDTDALWNDLSDFYTQWYVGSNITVVVYGRESIKKLESWARNSFKNVPSGKKSDNHIGIQLYNKSQLGVRVNIIPLQEKRELILDFPLPSTWKLYTKKPLNYLGRILGYEGKGSLHSFLQKKGWIETLSAGEQDLPGEYSEFSVRMSLTETGFENIDEVTASVFDYIALIREKGIQKNIFDESAKIADIEFEFLEPASPQTTVSTLAGKLHYYPVANILNSGFIYDDFDENLIKSYLDMMIPSNLRQIVIAPQLFTDHTEPYFEAEYSITPLSKSFMKRLNNAKVNPEFTLPEKNSFLPDNLTVEKSNVSEKPLKLIDHTGLTVWHLQDSSFGVPKNDVKIKFSTKKAAATPKDVISLYLYKALLERRLNEETYPAREAGLAYSFMVNREGLYLSILGYTDKQPLLLQLLAQQMMDNNFDEKSFALEKAALERDLRNQRFQPPYRQGLTGLAEVLFSSEYASEQLLNVLQSVTPASLKTYVTNFYSRLHVEALFHGSMKSEDVKVAVEMLTEIIGYLPIEPYEEHMRLLAGKDDLQLDLDIDHNDSSLIMYYQASDKTLARRARIALLGRMLATPFFTSLRTEQQLGYVAFAGGYPVDNWPGLIMVLQSPVAGPKRLQDSVDNFINDFQLVISSLSEEELDKYQNGLIEDLMKRDANLGERTMRLWAGIEDREFNFDEREKLVAAVREVSRDDLVSEYQSLLLSTKNEPLIVKSFGKSHRDESYSLSVNDSSVCKTSSCFDSLFKSE